MSEQTPNECLHTNFEAKVEVAKVTDQPGQFNIKGVIVCSGCQRPLRFGSRMLDYFALQSFLFQDGEVAASHVTRAAIPQKPVGDPRSEFVFGPNGEIIAESK